MSYPSYCCQRCGDCIGWMGRVWQFLRLPIHKCEPKKPWTVDRDGRVKTDKNRPVEVRRR